MSKRKCLIGVAAGLALAIGVSGVAQASITWNSQSLDVNVSTPPQDKKIPGPINSLFTDVITNYTNTGSGTPDRYATNTKVYFPTDSRVTTTGLPTCDVDQAGFQDGTTANALALCGPAKIGTGSAVLTSALGNTPAVVTAFNATPVGGFPRVALHSATPLANRTLIGTLKPSDVAGFGLVLDVPVDLGPFQGVAAITDFRVTIGKIKLPSKGKAASAAKKKKKKAAPKYYIMATCKTKKLAFQAITTYNTGPTSTATDSGTCKQKKAKKKKK